MEKLIATSNLRKHHELTTQPFKTDSRQPVVTLLESFSRPNRLKDGFHQTPNLQAISAHDSFKNPLALHEPLTYEKRSFGRVFTSKETKILG